MKTGLNPTGRLVETRLVKYKVCSKAGKSQNQAGRRGGPRTGEQVHKVSPRSQQAKLRRAENMSATLRLVCWQIKAIAAVYATELMGRWRRSADGE